MNRKLIICSLRLLFMLLLGIAVIDSQVLSGTISTAGDRAGPYRYVDTAVAGFALNDMNAAG